MTVEKKSPIPRKRRARRRRNGEGAIVKRANGSWEARLWVADPDDPTASARLVSRRARSEAEAKRKLDELKDTAGSRTGADVLRADRRLTVATFFERWSRALTAEVSDGHLRAKTAADTVYVVRRYVLPYWGERALADLRPSDAKTLSARLAEQGYAANTRRLVILAVRKMLTAAEADRSYPRGLAAEFRVPRPPVATDPKPAPDTEQMRTLLATVSADAERGNAAALLVLLGATTGARRGELIGAKVTDFDHGSGTWLIQRSVTNAHGSLAVNPTKGRQSRVVAVPAAVMRLVAAAAEEGRTWLAEADGQPFHPDRVTAYYRTHTAAVGAPTGMHGLRRYFLTQLLEATGGDLNAVAEVAGHQSLETTRRHYIARNNAGNPTAAAAVVANMLPAERPSLRVVS